MGWPKSGASIHERHSLPVCQLAVLGQVDATVLRVRRAWANGQNTAEPRLASNAVTRTPASLALGSGLKIVKAPLGVRAGNHS